ncbi:MAG: LysM peptidoglycan-binding domain-containing protein [Ornithinibacter sp.]
MSAVAWDPAEIGYAVGGASRRPHLVVLPGGDQGEGGGARITRRGRLALAAVVMSVLVGIATMGLGSASATGAPQVLTVRAGQTLSEIAAAELPSMSISQGILAIQLANGLSTAQVGAGQQLVIPAS